mmetsp:Transcript_7003/g.12625  ORF Transcript_7003/g.12625 Transcript_7003/m.12625 type:complete len:225 (-) Transcript_7003:243-917(-)
MCLHKLQTWHDTIDHFLRNDRLELVVHHGNLVIIGLHDFLRDDAGLLKTDRTTENILERRIDELSASSGQTIPSLITNQQKPEPRMSSLLGDKVLDVFDHGGVDTTAKTSVRCESNHELGRILIGGIYFNVIHELEQSIKSLCEWLCVLLHSLHAFELGCGNHLHGLGDLSDGSHRSHAIADDLEICPAYLLILHNGGRICALETNAHDPSASERTPCHTRGSH